MALTAQAPATQGLAAQLTALRWAESALALAPAAQRSALQPLAQAAAMVMMG
ncbi:MAG: hypothetical protein N2385_08285 [Chloroflexus sp.]|nr:hypothetical protein [Chloroflexus sp.]